MAFTHESPISSNTTTSTSLTHAGRSTNPAKYAAIVVAGAFINCFTPPEDDDNRHYHRKHGGSLHKYKKSPSGSSGTRSGSERSSSGTRSSSERSNGRRSSSERSHGTRSDRSLSSSVEKEAGRIKFSMAQIIKATRNFSPSLKIGQGGFGAVYRGTLEDGTLVAVKRAKRSDFGMPLGSEFQCEIKVLAQVEHLNLVRYFGYLEEEHERILLVEYVPNGTLREHLDCIHGDALDMGTRLDIAIDVCHAITYLHMYADHPIIHRDIKSSNILLTKHCRAKVADFGFARLVADESGCTHVSTQVKGTAGYLDPEYLRTYQLTEKSDVYSFGVLLVELVTGRRPIETKRMTKERLTPRWAIMKFNEGDAVSTMDPRLEATNANCTALERVLELAFICLATQRQNRPTMQRCAEILWSIRKDFKELSASDTCSFSPTSRSSRSFIE